ncbi:Hce2 domain-containing protein [Fusarium keratoplasticum]|nr:Hce2 domain-containing protein [Fusarium keratoplasticum]
MRVLALTAALMGLAAAAPAPAPSATLFDDIVAVSTSTACATPSATPITSTFWVPSDNSRKTCDKATYKAKFAPSDVKRGDFRDCASLLSAFGPHNGTFTIPAVTNAADEYGTGFVPIVKSDSCSLGVRAKGGVVLGDDDVDWIVQKTLQDYSSGFLMAARGSVDCDALDGGKKAKLYWQVYDSEKGY